LKKKFASLVFVTNIPIQKPEERRNNYMQNTEKHPMPTQSRLFKILPHTSIFTRRGKQPLKT